MENIVNSESGSSVRSKINKDLGETGLTVLTDGASVTWDLDNRKIPQAKLTSTQSFTINMTNVLSGAQGILKLITDTASAITLTFDTDFTNKSLNSTITTYTFPALTAQEYFLSFVVDGTTIEWIIGDATAARPFASVERTSTQSLATGATDAVSWAAETVDTSNIWDLSPNPTRLVVPGTGNKIAILGALVIFSANATGLRNIYAYKNGTVVSGALHQQAAAAANVQTTFAPIACVAGDYLEVRANQNSGATLTIQAYANVTFLDR